MKTYKIKYWDREGEGTTLIHSSKPIDVEEAAAVEEQLLANSIDVGQIQVEVFREVTNPLDLLVANIQRLGIGS
jgi:hypothetical protein